MAVIKQLATYDGSAWQIDEIGADINNISVNTTTVLSDIIGNRALTANRAIITDTNGVLSTSLVTDTELNYLSGTSSNIQQQITPLQNKIGSIERRDSDKIREKLIMKLDKVDLTLSDNNLTQVFYAGLNFQDSNSLVSGSFQVKTSNEGDNVVDIFARNYNGNGEQIAHANLSLDAKKDGSRICGINVDELHLQGRVAFSCSNLTTSITNITANGWKTGTINFSIPNGYTLLPGVVTCNNGYVILYNNSWSLNAKSVTVNVHNISSSAISNLAIYAKPIFINSTLI